MGHSPARGSLESPAPSSARDFYGHLQKLPLRFYQEQRTGDLMSRGTNDLAAVRMLIGPAVMHSLSALLVVSGAFIMMLRAARVPATSGAVSPKP